MTTKTTYLPTYNQYDLYPDHFELFKELENFFSFNDLKPDHTYIIKFDDPDRVVRITPLLGLEELTDSEIGELPSLDTYEWLGSRNNLHIYTEVSGFDWEVWS